MGKAMTNIIARIEKLRKKQSERKIYIAYLDIMLGCGTIKLPRSQQFMQLSTDSEDDDIQWITIHGAKIPLKDGVAIGGPEELKGKDFSDAKSVKPNPNSGIAAKNDCKFMKLGSAAQKAYDNARSNEVEITSDMCSLAEELGVEMHGLEFSVKTASSVEEKVERNIASKRSVDKTPEQIIKSMGDIVRYTQMCEHDRIAEVTQKTIDSLKDKGYNVTELDNKYNNPNATTYRGVHISAISPNGQKFELQVHSEQSMKVKEKNHILYEECRKVGTPSERVEELVTQMRNNASKLQNPKGIEKLESFKND